MDSQMIDGADFYTCFCLCTQIEAAPDDDLPDILCINCSHELENAFNFIQSARQADAILRENSIRKLDHQDIDVEVIGEDNSNVKKRLESNDGTNDEECVMEELLDDGQEELTEMEILEVETVDAVDGILEDVTTERTLNLRNMEPHFEGELYAEDEADDEFLIEYNEDETSPVSNGAKWKCIQCKRVLLGSVSYEGHMNMHLGLRPYKSETCLCTFRCKKSLELHLELGNCQNRITETYNGLVSCTKCTKSFEMHAELEEHCELSHPESYPVQCKRCPLLPPLARTKLAEHFRFEHPSDYNKYFAVVEQKNTQIKATCTPPNRCPYCTKGFSTSSYLRKHIRGVHPEEKDQMASEGNEMVAQCDLCKKQLLQRNLEKHMALHEKKEREANEVHTKYLCAFCSRECKNLKSLQQHVKMHQGESPNVSYLCTDCDRSYATQHLLQQHRKQAHKERDNHCSICGNSFKLKNQLMNHMKLHLEKNIECPHCDKKYARKFDLDVHMRSHTGELPFACHLCERRFAIKVRLTYHLQKHYGIKHRCKLCNAEFNSKQKLKAHSYKHTGMPYRCHICDGHGFSNRDVFKRHLARVHNSAMSDEALAEMFQKNTGKTTRIRPIDELEQLEHITASESDGGTAIDIIKAEDIAMESEIIHN